MLLFVVPFMFSLCAFAVCAVMAPDGWEDEDGFHYGIRPTDDRR